MQIPKLAVVSKKHNQIELILEEYDPQAAEHLIYRAESDAGFPAEDGYGSLVAVITDPTQSFIDTNVDLEKYYYQPVARYHQGTITQPPSVPQGTQLASSGTAAYNVVVGPSASQDVIGEADELANYLSQITGAAFSRTTGDGTSGIVVGKNSDFQQLDYNSYFDPNDLFRGDEHIVKSHENGVHIIGISDHAAKLAVWTFLKEIGYRHYFPMHEWEIIPNVSDLFVDVDKFESPSYISRQAPQETSWSDSSLWNKWEWHNRTKFSFDISNTHTYGHIVNRNESEFAANSLPNVALENSWTSISYTSGNTKFRVSQLGLVNAVIQDAVDRINANPSITSISMDPSDGGNWTSEEDPTEWNFDPVQAGYTDPTGTGDYDYSSYDGGHITDRVVFLANEVAKAINALGHGQKYVGLQAYNLHISPPNIPVHPNICAFIATSFVTGGWTFAELANAWFAKGAVVGERGYYNTFVWSTGLGRHGTASDLQGLADRIPNNYNLGVRFIRANSVDSWPLNGIAYYLSSRLLWDITDGTAESIYEEFLENCYGPVKEDMRNLHDLFISRTPPRTREDILARCYGALKSAYEKNPSAEIVARLNQCAMYTQYLELYHILPRDEESWSEASEEIGVYTYRMMGDMLSPVTQLYRYMERSDTSWNPLYESRPLHSQSVGNLVNDPPWKVDQPITQEEIDTYIAEGDANYEEYNFDFDLVEFDDDTLVPAKEVLNLPATPQGDQGWYYRGSYIDKCFFWLEEGAQNIHLYGRGGRIWRNRGDIDLTILSPLNVLVEPVDRNLVIPVSVQYHSIEVSGIPSPDEGANGKYKMIQSWIGSHDFFMQNWNFEETEPKNNWKFEMEIQEEGDSPLQGWWTLKDESDTIRSTSDSFSIEEWDEETTSWEPILFTSRTKPWEATGWDELLHGVSLTVEHGFKLTSPFSGVHTLNWRDGDGGFIMDWDEGQRFVMKGTLDRRFSLQREAVLYFYVPKGTTKVGGYTSSFKRLLILDKSGNTVFSGGEEPDPASGYFSWDVPEGEDGGLWRLSGNWPRSIGFGSIPPYMARSAEEVLLPEEVIDADKET